jgi:hypothetical protein
MSSSMKALLAHIFLKHSYLEKQISDKIPNEMIASIK